MEVQEKIHADEPADESDMRYLTFLTDHQLFGLPITEIVQITRMQEMIPLPQQPYYIKGIINLRGQIIPVMDVRLRLGKQEAEVTERTCIIIIRVQESNFGLIVDEVDEVVDIMSEQVSVPPNVGADLDKVNDYLTGIAHLKAQERRKECVVMLLHAGKMLGRDECATVARGVGDDNGTASGMLQL